MSQKKAVKSRTVFKILKTQDSSETFSTSYIPGIYLHRKAVVRFKSFVILFLLNGTGSLTDQFDKKHRLGPGSLVLRHPGRTTTLIRDNAKKWFEFAIRFPKSFYDAMLKTQLIDDKLTVSKIPLEATTREINTFMDYVQGHNTMEYTGPALVEAQKLILYFQKASEHKIKKTFTEEACSLLKKRLEENIPLNELTSKTGMSYESFRKKFKSETGDSPMNYRIKARIEKAREILLEPGIKIKEAAYIMNYADVSDFSRQFKKFTGQSPAEYIKSEK